MVNIMRYFLKYKALLFLFEEDIIQQLKSLSSIFKNEPILLIWSGLEYLFMNKN